ncbi:endoplasmic reticulum aminopeptidase 1-like isoform X2 [Strix uralensis]|uniref:endoplasmic reticulum aminopeptidase 1-like isoform X2 n=1 Tax=Strix uralensis TaxID=36305 RepID=UPI003DA6D041
MNRDSMVTEQNLVVIFGFASCQEDYFLRRCFDSMAVDTLNSSHPVSTPVEDPAQILEKFNNVSHEKGSRISDMRRDYLSADVFKAGLVQDLQKYSSQDTKNEDLWNSMTKISCWRTLPLPTEQEKKHEKIKRAVADLFTSRFSTSSYPFQ